MFRYPIREHVATASASGSDFMPYRLIPRLKSDFADAARKARGNIAAESPQAALARNRRRVVIMEIFYAAPACFSACAIAA